MYDKYTLAQYNQKLCPARIHRDSVECVRTILFCVLGMGARKRILNAPSMDRLMPMQPN